MAVISKNRAYLKYYKLIKKNKISTYKVAKETGIAIQTFYAWKKDDYTPKVEKLKLIADYFSVPLDYFLEG